MNGIVPDRQFPVPDQRRRDGRPRLHDEPTSCSTCGRDGSASGSRTCGSTKGIVDPASLGFPPAVTGALRRRAVFPARSTSADSRHRRQPRRQRPPQHLLVPADLHAAGGQPCDPGRIRLCACTRSSARTRAGRRRVPVPAANYTRRRTTRRISSARTFASFLLGQPTGGIDRPQRRAAELHDGSTACSSRTTGRSRSRLTINLGLRYELEGATTEAQNRNVRGFDPDAHADDHRARPRPRTRPTRSLSCRRRRSTRAAACSSRPTATAGSGTPTRTTFSRASGSRIRLNDKTVLRGGAGVYTVPVHHRRHRPARASRRARRSSPRNDLGLTFRRTLANPYPDGVLQPPATRYGANTFLGQRHRPLRAARLKNGQNAALLVSMQRELPGQWLLEVGYVGSRGYDLTTDVELNAVPRQYLSTSKCATRR